ncbi:hypothetical protein [Flavivirga aquatica]|nr:hypothetical protein [Flavivirga aquatica]
MSHQHWFTLGIEHQYFYNNACSVFELLPVKETQRIMKNYGIRFQKLGNLYRGYAEVGTSKKIWEELQTAEDLYFQLINTDPNFDSYTNVPLPKKEETLTYITNSEITNRLNKEESVIPNSDLDIRQLRFNVSVQATETVSVVIKNSQGQTVFNQVSPQNQSYVSVNISALGTGIYQLWIDDALLSTFLGTSEPIEVNCYGILHIQMRNILESLKENTVPILKVNFEPRATFWEYIVIVSQDKKIEIQEMSIESVNSEKYLGPEERIVMENNLSHVFTSANTIKLYQKPEKHDVLKIRYTNQFSDTLLELDMKMPVPAASSLIIKNKNNENLYYSQTIIYV